MKKLFILCALYVPVIAMDRPDNYEWMVELGRSLNGSSKLDKEKQAKAFKNKCVSRLAIRLPFEHTFADCYNNLSTDSAPDNDDEWYMTSEDECDLAKNELRLQKTRLYYQQRAEKNAHLQGLLSGIKNPEVAQILDNLTTRQTITLLDQLEKPEYDYLPLDQACRVLCGQLGYLNKDKAL